MRIRHAPHSRWVVLAFGVVVVTSSTASAAERHTNALRAPAKSVASSSTSAKPAGASAVRRAEPKASPLRRAPAAPGPSVKDPAPSSRSRVGGSEPSGIKWTAPQPAPTPAGIKWSAPEPAAAPSGIKWSARGRGR